MQSFFLEHIDALITTAGGIFACFYGFRAPPASATLTRAQPYKLLRVFGPLLVLFGILRFFIDHPSAPEWQRYLTSDGVASAEFPATPQAKQQTDTMNGVSALRTTLTHDVPFKDIALFLSFSPIPSDGAKLTDRERITATTEFFTQQDLQVAHESPVQIGASSGFAVDLQRDGGKVRMWLRVAYVGGKVYRVVASSTGSHHDDPIVRHFLDSFRIERSAE
jgi:hypothetical protein